MTRQRGGLLERLALVVAGGSLAVLCQYLYAKSGSEAARKRSRSPSRGKEAPRALPAELEAELFSRNLSFFERGFKDIREAFVIVVGLGGVGSHAAHMLARSGVRHLRLIDFDQVSLSSLNRHAVATWADVGTPKAACLRERLRAIIPGVDIDARACMFRKEDAAELLSGVRLGEGTAGARDTRTGRSAGHGTEDLNSSSSGGGEWRRCYVLDCIDDVRTKSELVAWCVQHGLPVISSLGAGLKCDPTRLHITSLKEATRDPLGAKLKWRLKAFRDVDPADVQVLYSSEMPASELLPLSDEQNETPGDFGIVDHFRVRVLPVLGTTPAIFGQAMASWVLCELGDKPFNPAAGARVSKSLRNRMYQRLRRREMEVHGEADGPVLDLDDVEHLITNVWHARCPVTGMRMVDRNPVELVRWDPSKDGPRCRPNNLVLLSAQVVQRLDQEGHDAIPPDKRAKIEAVLRTLGSDW